MMDSLPYRDSEPLQKYSDNEDAEDTSKLLDTTSDELQIGAILNDDIQPSQSTIDYDLAGFSRKPTLLEDQIFQSNVVNSIKHKPQVEFDLEEGLRFETTRPKRNRRRVYDPQEQVLYPPDERIKESVQSGARLGARFGARFIRIALILAAVVLFFILMGGFFLPWLLSIIVNLSHRTGVLNRFPSPGSRMVSL